MDLILFHFRVLLFYIVFDDFSFFSTYSKDRIFIFKRRKLENRSQNNRNFAFFSILVSIIDENILFLSIFKLNSIVVSLTRDFELPNISRFISLLSHFHYISRLFPRSPIPNLNLVFILKYLIVVIILILIKRTIPNFLAVYLFHLPNLVSILRVPKRNQRGISRMSIRSFFRGR